MWPGLVLTTTGIIIYMQGIAGTVRTRDLTEDDLTKLREEVDKYTTEGDLRRYVNLNIKRLKEIGCYRGRRHINVRVLLLNTCIMNMHLMSDDIC